MRLSHMIRALRLPFLTASGLPFVLGVLSWREQIAYAASALVLAVVLLTHLAANLVNDYADREGDALDPEYFGFFGGSKLIQSGVLRPEFYLRAAAVCGGLACLTVVLAALLSGLRLILPIYAAILVLGWAYSHGPLRLCYRGWGEFTIFLLFGPATVIGGYYLQAGIWPPASLWLLAVAMGLLTAAVLVANEVPDAPQDSQAGKRTLVVRLGAGNGHMLYANLSVGAFVAIALAFVCGQVGWFALLSFAALIPALIGWRVLQQDFDNKHRLVTSSKMAILVQTWVGLILGVDAWRTLVS